MANSQNTDLNGKLVVIAAQYYEGDAERSAEERTVLVQGGFGALPDTAGTALYVRERATGRTWRAEGFMVDSVIGDCPPEEMELLYTVVVMTPGGVEQHEVSAASATAALHRVREDKGWTHLPRKLSADANEELLEVDGEKVVISVKKA